MGKKRLPKSETEIVPEPFVNEVLHLIDLIQKKTAKDPMATYVASGSSPEKDRLTPEEFASLKDLF